MDRAQEYDKEKMIEKIHLESMSNEDYQVLKSRLREQRIKKLYDADIEKGALDHAMSQMKIWNTWNP